MLSDSVDKVVGVYLACLCKEPFEYKFKKFRPRRLRVSPSIIKGLICPPKCAGCCPVFSLDYLPHENAPENAHRRGIPVNDRVVYIKSIMQSDWKDHFCRFVDHSSGRCLTHKSRPLSCDFETLRFKVFADESRPNLFGMYPFGRGWAFQTVLGIRGARCVFAKETDHTRSETIRKLKRLDDWAHHFKISTKIPDIIEWIENNITLKPLYL